MPAPCSAPAGLVVNAALLTFTATIVLLLVQLGLDAWAAAGLTAVLLAAVGYVLVRSGLQQAAAADGAGGDDRFDQGDRTVAEERDQVIPPVGSPLAPDLPVATPLTATELDDVDVPRSVEHGRSGPGPAGRSHRCRRCRPE